MSLETTLLNLKEQIEEQIADFGSRDITPPLHLLELRSYLCICSNNGTQTGNLSDNATASNQIALLRVVQRINDQLQTERSTYQNLGKSTWEVIKPSSGFIYAFTIYNRGGQERWIQMYDSLDAPLRSDTPVESYIVPSSSFLVLDSNYFGTGGLAFIRGITFAFSTRANSYTPALPSELELHVKYK